jgi:hypothetical protein
MMVHLDVGVDDVEAGVERAVELGASVADHQPRHDGHGKWGGYMPR